jgi:hypothetical protein
LLRRRPGRRASCALRPRALRPRVGCQRPARAICATRLHASWPFGRPEGASAKIVAAEGEYQAAVKLGQAADIITQHPVALQLRTLQTMAEISVEKNSTIIFPAQFMTTVQEAFSLLSKDSASK